jgi:hypothetical protein
LGIIPHEPWDYTELNESIKDQYDTYDRWIELGAVSKSYLTY